MLETTISEGLTHSLISAILLLAISGEWLVSVIFIPAPKIPLEDQINESPAVII
jgi:hypothetical protein